MSVVIWAITASYDDPDAVVGVENRRPHRKLDAEVVKSVSVKCCHLNFEPYFSLPYNWITISVILYVNRFLQENWIIC